MEAAEAAIDAAQNASTVPQHAFSDHVEHALAHITEVAAHNLAPEQRRWYAIKIFERDEKVLERLQLSEDILSNIEDEIQAAERVLDDDAASIITNERYLYIASILKGCYKRGMRAGCRRLTASTGL